MKSSRIIIPLLSINIGLLVFTFLLNKQKPKDYSYDYFYSTTRIKSVITTKSELQSINPIFFIGKDTLHAMNLSDIIHGNTLCYYFSSRTCPPCLDHIHELIKRIFPDYRNRKDIIFICNDLEHRFKDNYYNKRIIWNTNKKLNIEFENKEIPTFFILNRDLKATCVFLTDKMTPEYTEDYLKIIKRRFLDKNS